MNQVKKRILMKKKVKKTLRQQLPPREFSKGGRKWQRGRKKAVSLNLELIVKRVVVMMTTMMEMRRWRKQFLRVSTRKAK